MLTNHRRSTNALTASWVAKFSGFFAVFALQATFSALAQPPIPVAAATAVEAAPNDVANTAVPAPKEWSDANEDVHFWSPPPAVTSGYDRGFFIQSEDATKSPFRLKFNLQNQFRYTGFARSDREWTDSAGTVLTVPNRNDFDINRGRLIFSGYAIDPDLNYYINLDYTTLRDDSVTILLGWVNYKFNDSFDLYFGKGKLPGGREWLLTSMYTMAPDRSMATTFFRPSITTGVWAKGEPADNLYYHAAIGNGFNTASSGFRELDTNFAYSGNAWWEPLGEFGGLYSDLKHQPSPVIRLGTSVTQSRQSGQQFDNSQPEDSFIRLSDGTNITQVGALSPGVLVTDYAILLSTFDAGFKWNGFSLHTEYFLRWLSDIRGTGPIPAGRGEIFDQGFFVQAGFFVVPHTCEVYSRASQIFGDFGEGTEYAAGFNWFIQGTENWRFGTDIAYLTDSPTDQIRTGYDVGATGLLVRAQLQTMF